MSGAGDVIVAEFAKNSRETIRVVVGSYRGHKLVHIRAWVAKEGGEAKGDPALGRDEVSAASAVIDRAAGKPVQAIEASGFTRPASELSDDELAAIIAGEQRARAEEEDGG